MASEIQIALHSSDKELQDLALAGMDEHEDVILLAIMDKLTETEGQEMQESFFKVGECYFIRTATMYQCGRVTKVGLTYLVLEDASWIPITGRFHRIFIDGKFEEVEPFKDPCYVNLMCIIDATLWTHPLPREPQG